MKHLVPIWILAGLFLCGHLHGLTPDPMFGDNMVLQREMAVPIWGKAAPGSEVSVKFAGKSVQGKTDDAGKWKIKIDPGEASSEARDLVISGGDKVVTFSNVLVGEVWLGSGQSNMAGRVAGYAKNDPTLAKLVAEAPYPEIRIRVKGWQEADATTINQCSAILLAFGERLHRDLKVPIGLYFGAVGGTPSGAWIPEETFKESKKRQDEIAEFAKTWDKEQAMKLYQAKLANWEKAAAKAKAEGTKPKGRAPKEPVGPGGMTRGGAQGGLFARHIAPSRGFAIRGVLWDQGEAGTGILGLDQDTAMSELIRGWRELWGQGEFPFIFVQKPSGEGCAFSNENPITREANKFAALPATVGNHNRGRGRYLYTRLMLDNANSWMVPASDLGGKVHPVNKWGYGNRAAEVAQQKVYQVDGVQAYGPLYASHTIDGGNVTVKFTEVGSGLTTAHADKIQGFCLAGKDGEWHWADATVSGKDTVVVSSADVPSPVKVSYAYAPKRQWANLFNKNGLPALAFTTQ